MYNVIKAKFLEVRKAKDTNAIKTLSTLIGAIDMIAKNKQIEVTNEIVFDAIVKMLKGVNETIPLVQDQNKIEVLNNEKTLLESFMPKQMTEVELETAIAEIAKALKTHSLPDLPKPSAKDAPSSRSTIVRRMPTPEPYPHHENLDPAKFKPSTLDRDSQGRDEGETGDLSSPAAAWKKYMKPPGTPF